MYIIEHSELFIFQKRVKIKAQHSERQRESCPSTYPKITNEIKNSENQGNDKSIQTSYLKSHGLENRHFWRSISNYILGYQKSHEVYFFFI